MTESPKRPNRSAAQRRQQQHRADTRAFSRLLLHTNSFQHRGAQLPSALREALDSLPQQQPHHQQSSPSSEPFGAISERILEKLESLETRLHYIDLRLNSYFAPSQYEQRYDISDLLDSASIRRIDRSLDEAVAQPDQATAGHWWSCPVPGCGYKVPHGDRLRSQKKAQHRRKHEHESAGEAVPAQPTASAAESKPATRISGKTKPSDVTFVPLDRLVEDPAPYELPGEEATASSATAAVDETALHEHPGEEAPASSAPEVVADRVRLFVKSDEPEDDGKVTAFTMLASLPVSKIFKRYRELRGVREDQAIFTATVGGTARFLTGNETPASLHLTDGCFIRYCLSEGEFPE